MNNTYRKISFENEVEEMNEDSFFRLMKEQSYGSIVMSALLNYSKSKIMEEAEYENLSIVDSEILETIKYVESIKHYIYSNKYRPELTTGKRQVLKKLDKLLKKDK